MDGAGASAYLRAHMDRSVKLLLTLLALLTGLTAAPAQARMCAADGAGVEQVEPARGGASGIAATLPAGERQARQRQRRERELGRSPPPVNTVLIPSIQLGDRARE
jgi:hypothetical protein